ncbi:hypothetical protein [Rhodococcus sp. NPDC057529]|uniref:hypothetical protein n=1 Tax=Rhodococcus sp. NPDC057529 TaxID=3346158 RepID=UPI003672C488
MTQWSTVEANHHQFVIGERQADTLAVTVESSLFDAGRDFLTVHTGVANGPVSIGIEILGDQPESTLFEDWENVAECTISTSALCVMTLQGEPVEDFTDLAVVDVGRYRVRVHARGRDVNWDMDVAEPTEDYLVQLWPVARVQGFVRLKKTDTAWSEVDPELPIAAPAVARESVQAPNPQALGRPKLKRLVNRKSVSRFQLRNFNAFKDVAQVDRLLAEKLLALSDDELRSVAQWLPRRALTRVGLFGIEWVSSGVTVLEAGLWERPKDVYAAAVRARTGGDPDVPVTQIVSVFDGQLVDPAHGALDALIFGFDPDPAVAAFLGLHGTLLAYGSHWKELVNDLEAAFPRIANWTMEGFE